MAALAACIHMGARERERGSVVVKPRRSIAGGMTGKAGGGIVTVSADSLMFTVHFGLVVGMTIDATELAVIRWIRMAI